MLSRAPHGGRRRRGEGVQPEHLSPPGAKAWGEPSGVARPRTGTAGCPSTRQPDGGRSPARQAKRGHPRCSVAEGETAGPSGAAHEARRKAGGRALRGGPGGADLGRGLAPRVSGRNWRRA